MPLKKKKGIIDGYSTEWFGPDDPLTREQMAVMLVKAYLPSSKSESVDLSFHDRDRISSWALDAIHIVVDQQIMQGFPGDDFRPQAFSTRAEGVVVLYRVLQLLNGSQSATSS